MNIRYPVIALLLLLAFPNPGRAQESTFDAYAPIATELIEQADAGDALASYRVGLAHYVRNTSEDQKQALKYLIAARKGYAEGGEETRVYAATIGKLIGDVYTKQASYAKALNAYIAAIDQFKKSNSINLDYWHTIQARALTLQSLSRYKESIPYLHMARGGISLLEGRESSFIGDTYLNEGISWEGLKEYQKSLETYFKALKIYNVAKGVNSAESAYAINNIAWVYRRINKYKKSNRWFHRALPIIEKREGKFSRNAGLVKINIGIVQHYLGNQDAAIRWTMRAMPYIKANPDITLEEQRWAFDTLARAFRSKNNNKRAITFAKLAVNAQQSIRLLNKSLPSSETAELSAEWRVLYQHLAGLLIDEGRISEAQAVLNMEKEQEVFEFLKRDASADLRKTRAILNDRELSEEQKIQAISKIPLKAARELGILRIKFEDGSMSEADEDRMLILQDAIQVASEQFEKDIDAFLADAKLEQNSSYKDQVKATGAYQEFLSKFKRRTAMLQIATISNATHLFLTLPEITIHKRVAISKAELSRLTFEALQAIEARATNANEKLNNLYKILIEPVAVSLRQSDVEVIMLNLDGFIRYVPFAALFDGDKYLVEDYALVLYTASVPTRFQKGNRQSNKSAGFGVTTAYPGFPALPGVRDELESLFIGEDLNGVLSGPARYNAKFTVRDLRRALLKKPQVLHIASHFSLVPGRESDSFLLMGDGQYLPLSEIRRKKSLSFRGIDLVTLSACQTARGSGDGSEIEGFGATVQLSGASSVLATLWPVADDATARLMQDFYGNLMEQDLDKAESLRQAQIKMLQGKGYAETILVASRGAEPLVDDSEVESSQQPNQPGLTHPYFWSPFILMGNWL